MDKQNDTGGSTKEPSISELENGLAAQNQAMHESKLVETASVASSDTGAATAAPVPAANTPAGTGNAVPGAVSAAVADGDAGKKNGTLQVMAFVLGIVIIILLFLLVIYTIIKGTDTVTPTPTVAPTSAGGTPAPEVATLTLTKPGEAATVDGKILVEGVASVSLANLTVQAFDNDGTVLGTATVELTGNANQTSVTYSVFLELEKSSVSESAYVQVYPNSEGKTSELTKTTTVLFETVSSERVKVFAPHRNMKYTGGAVLFRGQMQDFFEGSMGLRLVGGNGGILYDTSIQAQGDNYGQFASFEQMVNPGTIPSTAGGNGKWEFYDTSMADGSVTVLVTIPVSL